MRPLDALSHQSMRVAHWATIFDFAVPERQEKAFLGHAEKELTDNWWGVFNMMLIHNNVNLRSGKHEKGKTCREKSRICKISSISSFLWNSQRNSKNHASRCLISLFLAVHPTPWLFKNPEMLIQDLRSNYRENDGVIFIFGHFEIPRREKIGVVKKKLIFQDDCF